MDRICLEFTCIKTCSCILAGAIEANSIDVGSIGQKGHKCITNGRSWIKVSAVQRVRHRLSGSVEEHNGLEKYNFEHVPHTYTITLYQLTHFDHNTITSTRYVQLQKEQKLNSLRQRLASGRLCNEPVTVYIVFYLSAFSLNVPYVTVTKTTQRRSRTSTNRQRWSFREWFFQNRRHIMEASWSIFIYLFFFLQWIEMWEIFIKLKSANCLMLSDVVE